MAALGDRLGLDPKSRAALKLPAAKQRKSKFAGLMGASAPASTGLKIEVKDARLGTGDRAIIAAVFNRDAIQQHTVRRMVPLCKRRWPKLCQLAIRVLYSVGRQCRIETNECLSQAIF